MINRMRHVSLLLCLILVGWPQLAAADPDENVRIMIDAARSLEWSLPENRAYLLVKNETIESPVGVIFGYVDNEAACEELAEALNNPVRVGTFHCQAIY